MRRRNRPAASGGDGGIDLTRLTWIPLRGLFGGLVSGASAGKEEDHVVIVFVTRVLV
jgi:hypothetical protein